VRPLPDARVSTPLHWHEVPDCEPADFTVLTIPKRFAEFGAVKLQYSVQNERQVIAGLERSAKRNE
jgi:DNA primase